MNIGDWNRSGNAYEMLQFMKKSDEVAFSNKAEKLHFYLIACAKKHLKFRSNEEIKNGLKAAENHLRNLISDKEFRDQEWKIEGAAFSCDIGLNDEYPNPYSIDINITKDLKMVRIHKNVMGLQAKQYLMDLAYFIDKCMAYSRDSIGELPEEKFAKFLCPSLLRRKFNFPVIGSV